MGVMVDWGPPLNTDLRGCKIHYFPNRWQHCGLDFGISEVVSHHLSQNGNRLGGGKDDNLQ